MKSRVKIDSTILAFFIILTGFLYLFPQFYSTNVLFDNAMDFLGLFVVLSGNYLRMAARGHKKLHSQAGESLVVSGPYSLVRNPMYLGSFLMGGGFILIVWPWWSLLIFAGFFYLRFSKQVVREEEHMARTFGQSFADYKRKVPAVFPSVGGLKKIKFHKVFSFNEAWGTKETRGLFAWPMLAVILELYQEKLVFGTVRVSATITLFIWTAVIFALLLWVLYNYRDVKNSE